VISKLVIPFILIFALYVQFHGDFGPGGGFQAGVIFGAGVILYALIFGLEGARRAAPPWFVETSTMRSMASIWAFCWSSSAWASPWPR
jgi:multicomponent Na+:H+ antiporter subunit B